MLARAADYLARHGVESPQETAETLLMHVLGTDRAGIYARADGLDLRSARLFGRALCQRCAGTPLQHLTGEQQFFDLRLRVRPGVFVPRPETEMLVEYALEVVSDRRATVVDVGTGTGAVGLAIKHRRPGARVLATDISDEAVALARENAGRHGLDLEVFLGDLLDPLPVELRGELDLVVSNPPYVTREEYETLPADVRAEPFEALVGGTDIHGHLAREAPNWLRAGGWLVVEIGASQGDEVAALLSEGFGDVEILPDLPGESRVVRARRLGASHARA